MSNRHFFELFSGFVVTEPSTSRTDQPCSAAADTKPRRSRYCSTTWVRIGALAIAILPLGALGVASCLEPSSNGVGTHQQLGLPPCSMRVLVGIRCPSCGMTTSWAHFSRGQWWQSVQVNPGGFLLACFGIFVAFLAMQTFWTARIPPLGTQRMVTVLAVSILAVTLVDWAVRLAT